MAYFLATGTDRESTTKPPEEELVELPDSHWLIDGEILLYKDSVIDESILLKL